MIDSIEDSITISSITSASTSTSSVAGVLTFSPAP